MIPINALRDAGLLKGPVGNYHASLELAEHEIREVLIGAHEAYDLSDFTNLLSQAIEVGLIELDFKVGWDRTTRVIIKTKNIVGIAACEYNGYSLFLKVEPKVGTSKLLDLVIASGNAPDWTKSVQVDTKDISSVLEWKVRAFCRSVSELVARGGVRGHHLRKRENLTGIVKGRVVVSEFINSFARGRPEVIPCEYPSFEVDHKYNRLIKWCLRFSKLSLIELGIAPDLERNISDLERHFMDVKNVPPSPQFIKKTGKMPPNLRHYDEVIGLAKFLLVDLQFIAKPGTKSAGAIAIDMNQAYESAFRNLSSLLLPELSSKPLWRRPLYDLHGKKEMSQIRLFPDLFLEEDDAGCAVILDTKWKSIYGSKNPDGAASEFENYLVSPRTSDIYQATFYGLHWLKSQKISSECLCVLLYPTIGRALELRDSFSDDGGRIKIAFLGWDLSDDLESSVNAIWGRINDLRI